MTRNSQVGGAREGLGGPQINGLPTWSKPPNRFRSPLSAKHSDQQGSPSPGPPPSLPGARGTRGRRCGGKTFPWQKSCLPRGEQEEVPRPTAGFDALARPELGLFHLPRTLSLRLGVAEAVGDLSLARRCRERLRRHGRTLRGGPCWPGLQLPLTPRSSTSKTSVALGGMTPG